MIADPCCGFCRSSTDICLTRRQCEHHHIAAAKQRAEDNRPTITYKDPTGTIAAARADRSRKYKRRKP